MRFTDINLHPDLAKGIAEAGYLSCMPVQEQVLKNAFGGTDLYVQSQTGTGKTAAFLVTIFQRLLTEPQLSGRQALIMVPTRELAVQVEEEAKKIGKYLPFIVGSFYGGVGYAQQQRLLRDKAQIMVGTPGRVLDLNSSGQMPLMNLAFLILDEADRMFDMGFYPDLRKLIRVVPPADRRQTMLFSATLNAWVKNLAWEYTKAPLEIEIEPEHVTVEEIDQVLYHVPSEDKMRLLLGVFEREKPESALIFCNTKRYTEIIAKRLRMNGIDCEFIIGDLPQVKRLKVIDQIKSGERRFLVATDVAARGLDIEGLALVVNYDLPNEAENYIHRIGRTARAGRTGRAISLASEQDVYALPAIEKYLGKKIPSLVAEDSLYAETDKSARARIRTDMYGDDDKRGRADKRGPRYETDSSRSYGGRGGRSAPPRRTRQSDGQAGTADKSGGASRIEARKPFSQTKRRISGQGENVAKERERAGPDLSKIPFEERLAFYRKKYGAASSLTSENKQAPSAKPRMNTANTNKNASPSKAADGASKKSETGLFGKIKALFGKKNPRS